MTHIAVNIPAVEDDLPRTRVCKSLPVQAMGFSPVTLRVAEGSKILAERATLADRDFRSD